MIKIVSMLIKKMRIFMISNLLRKEKRVKLAINRNLEKVIMARIQKYLLVDNLRMIKK